RASIVETQTGLDAARQTEHQGELALVGAEKDLRANDLDLERSRTRLENLVSELHELAERLAEAEAEHGTARSDLDSALDDKQVVDRQAEEAQLDADQK